MNLFARACRRWLTLLAALTIAATATAQSTDDMSPEEAAYWAEAQKIWDSLDRRTGVVELPGGIAELAVPDEYFFLDAEDAAKVLVEVWGNPPDNTTLGMLMPDKYTPFDQDSWAVTLEYVEDGYVSDADAQDIDYDDLLRDMKKATRQGSRERERAGYGTVELVRWAEQPFYSSSEKKLYWAKELLFDGDQSILNYDIRALGRKGVLSMTFIASTDQLAEINAARGDILAMAQFKPGYRYEDYEPGNDKLAAYGVGALVAGTVAKKTGLLAALLIFLKKFGVIIAIAIVALLGKFKSLFKRSAT